MTPFDIKDRQLPPWIADKAMTSGNYPYQARYKKKAYYAELESLQIELVKMLKSFRRTGARMVLVFEGRDAAGKGGAIGAFRQYLSPRHARIVALSRPTEVEQGQWYFQRYAAHLPAAGDIALYDRSWYNRAVVEPVMGFCTPEQTETFLHEAPHFEKMICNDGIHLHKFWLNIGREMQLKRFHDRWHNPLKDWKISPVDLRAIDKWEAYTRARDTMFEKTHSQHAPWTIVRSNDKRRARLNIIRHVLAHTDYAGKDKTIDLASDPQILGQDMTLAGD